MLRLLLTVVALLSTAAQLGAQSPAANAPQPTAGAQAKPAPPVPAPASTAAPANAPGKPGQTPPPPAAAPQPAASSAPGAAAAPTPAPAGGANAATSAPAQAIQPEPYTYNPDGRRDPFTTLIGTGGSDSRGIGRRGDGPAGMAVADVSVRGVLQSRGALIAMIQGPDNKTYIVHQGDKLLDGVIKTITPQGLIVTQEVNDPLSLVKQREVAKLLRSLEVVKP